MLVPFGCLTQIGDGLAISLDRIALENCRACDEDVAAGACDQWCRFHRDAAVDLEFDRTVTDQ